MYTESSYLGASDFLARIDRDWDWLVNIVGPCTHQPRPAREPYEALIRAVAYQQLHAKAGDAILVRLFGLYADTCPTPEQLLETNTEKLKPCGFSMRKIETLYGIARGVLDGTVPSFLEACTMTDAELIDRVTSLKGIGKWTAEMLLIYTLSRMDILPADDFGVKDGYQRLKSLEKAPNNKTMSIIGEAWSPYRTIAAWYLWRVPRIKASTT